MSDASNKSFTLEECLRRLKVGHKLVYFDYVTGNMFQGHVAIVDNSIIFTYNMDVHEIPIKKVCGVLVNGISSTFKSFINGDFVALHLNSYDAFSVITPSRSYDMASASETAKYDICIGVSWLASEYSMHRVVPITKAKLTFYTVKMKIQEMAKERSLFFKELFLVMFT